MVYLLSDSDGHCGIRERDQVRAGGSDGRQDYQDSRLQLRREGRGGLLLRGRGAAALIQGTSSVADPECLSRILIFSHPGSRISDPGSRIPDPGSRIPDPGSRIPDPGSKNSNKREG
jgi:hypothetical protein